MCVCVCVCEGVGKVGGALWREERRIAQSSGSGVYRFIEKQCAGHVVSVRRGSRVEERRVHTQENTYNATGLHTCSHPNLVAVKTHACSRMPQHVPFSYGQTVYSVACLRYIYYRCSTYAASSFSGHMLGSGLHVQSYERFSYP